MERIPVLKMGRCLLVTIQLDMEDQTAILLQDDLAVKISTTGATGVLIDISVGSSRVDLQACKLEYSIVSPK